MSLRRETRFRFLPMGRLVGLTVLCITTWSQYARAQCPEIARIDPSAVTERFGEAMALDGDLLVIGAWSFGAGSPAGAVHVYRRNPVSGAWIEEAVLAGSDIASSDRFGAAVAVHGDRIIVGAPFHDGAGGSDSGAAYIFHHQGGGVWVEEQKLEASTPVASDIFGSSVGIENDLVAVGSPWRDPFGSRSGSVLVFRHQGGGSWTEDSELVDASSSQFDEAGTRVLVKAGAVFVASPLADNGTVDEGWVTVWKHNGSSWNLDQTIVSSTRAVDGEFGWSLGTDGNQLIIGAGREDQASANQAGAAYVFELAGGSWVETARLSHSSPSAHDRFGYSVAIDKDLALVGVPGFDDWAPSGGGGAMLFRRKAGAWVEDIPMTGSTRKTNSEAGRAVALHPMEALVGDRLADNNAGVNSQGTVYVHPTAELRLTTSETAPAPGQPFSLRVLCGNPGERVLLALTEINGKSRQRPVFRSVFGVNYRFAKNFAAPDPAKGVNIGITAVKFGANGKVVSNQVNIDL